MPSRKDWLARSVAWADLIGDRVRRTPSKRAITYVDWRADTEHSLTYADLDRRAAEIGSLLVRSGHTQKPVLLAYPYGLEFIAALVGCFYSGSIPVPVPLTDRGRSAAASRLLRAVLTDSGSPIILSTQEGIEVLKAAISVADSEKMLLIATDASPPHQRLTAAVTNRPDDIAYVQYTSGTTAAPRGAIIRNYNVAAACEQIRLAYGLSERDRGVVWVPLHHAMGLVWGAICPLVIGFEAILMSPIDFIESPLRWLRCMSEFRATVTSAPNFGYELCVRRSSDSERSRLDLRPWRIARVAAGPVRGKTLRDFAALFAASGFRSQAFCPSYGLAEATLVATTVRPDEAWREIGVEATELRRGIITNSDSDGGIRLVPSGRPVVDLAIEVVDPDSGSSLGEGAWGEINVAGPQVITEYWNCPHVEPSRWRRERNRSWFRTGDLGALYKGELLVAGRLTDTINVRGVKYQAEQIENLLSNVTGIRSDRAVAFGVPCEGTERVVLVAEVADGLEDSRGMRGIVSLLRQAVAEYEDVAVSEVALVSRETIPVTSSGKVQRQYTRVLWQKGELAVLYRWQAPWLSLTD